MEKTSGLGRGLGSLIPNKKKISGEEIPAPIAPPMVSGNLADFSRQEKVAEIPVERISPNPHQPRTSFNEEEMVELQDSIREHGIIQPLIVTRSGDGWQIIAGERRWRAAKAIGLKTVPAIVRDMTEQKKMEIALIENLQRSDLNPLDVASAYQKLIDEFNLSQDELAKKVGKSRPAVANTLRLLGAAEEVKLALSEGTISEGHARSIVSVPLDDQPALLKKILQNKLNVREAEKQTRAVVVAKHLRKINYDPDLGDKEERLQSALSTKVEIKKIGHTGQIVIKFYSEDEFRDIYDRLIKS